MNHRRKYKRVRPRPEETVEAQVIGEDFMDVLRVRDISAGGLGVVVGHGFKGCNLDAQIDIVLSLPKQKPFMARGLIRHLSDDGKRFGVQFTSIPDDARTRIEKYVEARVGEGGEIL